MWKPTFEASVYADGYIWITALKNNALLRVNASSGEVEAVASILELPFGEWMEHMFCGIVSVKGDLWIIPYFLDAVYIYHIADRRYERLDLPPATSHPMFKRQAIYFNEVHYWNGCLYLVPNRYPGILKIDVGTHEMKCLDHWVEMISPRLETTMYGFFKHAYFEDGTLLLPMGCTNAVLELNLSDETYQVHEVGEKGDFLQGIIPLDKDEFLLFPRKSKCLLRWSRRTGSSEHVASFPDAMQEKDFFFCCAQRREDTIAIYPFMKNHALVLDTKQMQMLPTSAQMVDCQSVCHSATHTYFVCEHEIFVDDFAHPLNLKVDEGSFARVYADRYRQKETGSILIQECQFPLDEFLRFCILDESRTNFGNSSNCGYQILQEIIE